MDLRSFAMTQLPMKLNVKRPMFIVECSSQLNKCVFFVFIKIQIQNIQKCIPECSCQLNRCVKAKVSIASKSSLQNPPCAESTIFANRNTDVNSHSSIHTICKYLSHMHFLWTGFVSDLAFWFDPLILFQSPLCKKTNCPFCGELLHL